VTKAGLNKNELKKTLHYEKKKITYDLPPNSSVTGVKCFAAAVMTILPTWPLPV
jgi:hypothetical protein